MYSLFQVVSQTIPNQGDTDAGMGETRLPQVEARQTRARGAARSPRECENRAVRSGEVAEARPI